MTLGEHMSKKHWVHRDRFDHRKMDVYMLAFEFYVAARTLCGSLHGVDLIVRNQFIRAALSVCANISEGSGEWRPKEKGRFYRMARRSASECACMLDAIEVALNLGPETLDPMYHQLQRVITMLIVLDKKMVQRAADEKKKKPKTN